MLDGRTHSGRVFVLFREVQIIDNFLEPEENYFFYAVRLHECAFRPMFMKQGEAEMKMNFLPSDDSFSGSKETARHFKLLEARNCTKMFPRLSFLRKLWKLKRNLFHEWKIYLKKFSFKILVVDLKISSSV